MRENELEYLASIHNGKCLSKKYVNSHYVYEWKCSNEDHKSFMMNHNNVKRGHWCPRCAFERNALKAVGRSGRKWTKIEKRKRSIMAKARGFGKWMIGRKLKKETTEKMRDRRIGIPCKASTKKKIGEANSGEKNGMFGRIVTQETRNKLSEASLRMWKNWKNNPNIVEAIKKLKEKDHYRKIRLNQIFPKKDTSIELIIKQFLNILSVKYKQHKVIPIEHRYQCDFYLKRKNLIIECDGMYWHNFPYGRNIDIMRSKEIIEKGYKLLRLWENDIRKMTLNDFKEKLKLV